MEFEGRNKFIFIINLIGALACRQAGVVLLVSTPLMSNVKIVYYHRFYTYNIFKTNICVYKVCIIFAIKSPLFLFITLTSYVHI